MIALASEIIRCKECAFPICQSSAALPSACASSLRLPRIVFGGTDFCADSGQHFIAGYQLRAPCIYIRHAPGNLFIPSLGDGLRRIFGLAWSGN